MDIAVSRKVAEVYGICVLELHLENAAQNLDRQLLGYYNIKGRVVTHVRGINYETYKNSIINNHSA